MAVPATSETVYFQASGNRVSDNRVTGNATQPGGADIGLEGGVFGTLSSVNNCFSGNTFSSSIPAAIEGTWGCQNATTPNGGAALFTEILRWSRSRVRATRAAAGAGASADDAPAVPGRATQSALRLT